MTRAVKAPPLSRGRHKHRVAVLVDPDTEGFEVGVIQQVFGRRTGTVQTVVRDIGSPYEVILCGESERYILPSGADLGQLAPLHTLLTADTVMVPGVQKPLASRSSAILGSVRGAYQNGARMVSYCGGAFVLGRAGVLDGRQATTHWLLADEFRAVFPRVRLTPDKLFVDDGPVHTSGGVFATMDLALHLLALDMGDAHANDVGRLLVAGPRRPGAQAQYVKQSLRADDDLPMGSFLHWLREHVYEPLTLAGLAQQQHLSQRSLVRKFRQATGMSVFDWINQERVSQAKALLETTDHPVGDIAVMVGFQTPETLRRNFDRHVGTTAGAYRAEFRRQSHRTDEPVDTAPVASN